MTCMHMPFAGSECRVPRPFWMRPGSICVGLAVLAVAALLFPSLGDAFAMRRVALAHGAWWQVFTGHLAHFNVTHLAWDVAALLILGIIAECRGRCAAAITLAGSAMVISAAILGFTPNISEYRGLSGIDSSLFAFVAVGMLMDALRDRRWAVAIFITLFLTAFLGKTCFELATGHALFVQDMGPDVLPVALAHVAGGVWGIVVAVAQAWRVGPGFSGKNVRRHVLERE